MASGRTWGGTECDWYQVYDMNCEQVEELTKTFVPSDKVDGWGKRIWVFIPKCPCCGAKYDYDEAKKADPLRKYTTLKYMHINNVLKLYEIDMVTPIKMYLCLECVFEGCFIDSIIDKSLIPSNKYNAKWHKTVENGCKYGSCCSPY